MGRFHRRRGARLQALVPGALLIFTASLFPAADVLADAKHEHAHEHEHGDDHEDTERIVVTPSPLHHNPEELATPVVQLDREEILEDLRFTVGDTISNTPGVTSSGFSAGASRPVIRGQDAFRTEVLEGGLSTQDVSRLSPDHAVPVNPLAAQSIEIVRGPAVLRYGGGASAGVVNVLTNRVPTRRIEEYVRGRLFGSYGDNDEEWNGNVVLEGGVGPLAWHVDGLYLDADEYDTGKGNRQPGSQAETWAVSGGASLVFDRGRIGFGYSHFDSEYGVPEDEPVLIDMETDRYRFEGDLDDPVPGLRKIRLRGVYSDYTHDEVADGAVGQTYDNEEFDGRLEFLHEPILGFVGALGMHGRHQELEAGGEAEEFLAQSDTSMFAVYLFEERPIGERFDLQLGTRVEGNWVDGTPINGEMKSRRFLPLSGSVALVSHLTEGWTLGLTGSASQRAPSQVELFARGPHEATSTFEIGDPGFDEETSYTTELRLSGSTDRVTFEGSLFGTYYDDYIFGQLTGVTVDEDGTVDPMGELDQLRYEARNAVFWGGELAVGVNLFELCGGTVGTDWQLDYVRARFAGGSGDGDVPRIPPMRWGGSFFYKHDRVTGRFGFLRHEAQWNPGANEFDTGAFTMLDLSARVRLPFFEEQVPTDLVFTAKNLLDEDARNAVSFTKEEVLLPGRSFRVGLQMSF